MVHGLFSEILSNSCNFLSTGTHQRVFFFLDVLPHMGTSPLLTFLAMVNRTHLLAPVRASNCARSLKKIWWWFCGRPQILPHGPAMHQSCSTAWTQSQNKCFWKVQGRTHGQIKAASEKKSGDGQWSLPAPHIVDCVSFCNCQSSH